MLPPGLSFSPKVGSRLMNVIAALDKNYMGPAKVMLKSLAVNNKGPITAYLLHSEIALRERERFVMDCVSFSGNLKISFVEVDEKPYQAMPGAFGLPHTAYYRFEAAALLPQTVERALYLDCDIIVNRSIEEFYNTAFEDNLFVACEDIGVSVLGKYRFLTIFARLGQALRGGRYFNSGVLLVNMDLARQLINPQDAAALVESHRSAITFADQDILNYLYGGRTKYADYKKYNMGAGYITAQNESWALENAAIIHYYGAPDSKPWLKAGKESCSSPIARLWWEYAESFPEYESVARV
jgi:lipopolysaccharide biosynthesis glycosyltransferase